MCSFNNTESIMTNKQLVNQLHNNMICNLDFTDEQVQLIIKLQQSFETPEETALRLEKFQELISNIGK